MGNRMMLLVLCRFLRRLSGKARKRLSIGEEIRIQIKLQLLKRFVLIQLINLCCRPSECDFRGRPNCCRKRLI